MNAFETRFVNLARRLIAKYGTAVTITRKGAATYNTTTRTTTATNTVVTTSAYVTAPTTKTWTDGTQVQSSALAFVMSGDVALPAPGDLITLGGAKYTVGMVDPVYAGGVVAVFTATCRRN